MGHTKETTEVLLGSQLGKWFIRAFCITSHSSQGSNIPSGEYLGVHEVERMKSYAPKGLYVALTRVTDAK